MNNELVTWTKLYTKDLYKWALYKTSDKMLAEDLVQDTFLVATENFAKFNKQSQPKTWLMGILKNKIADYYKNIIKNTAQNSISIEDFHAFFEGNGGWKPEALPQIWAVEKSENLLDNPLFSQVLHQCQQNLSPLFNACLKLKFLEEKKAEEICHELQITATNYWQILHRAKMQLRKCIENNWFKKSETMS
jgi:RNA polymerase sigma-70 factor (ECF subfamily)